MKSGAFTVFLCKCVATMTLVACSQAIVIPSRTAEQNLLDLVSGFDGEDPAENTPKSNRSFVVGKYCFLKDGQPFRYASGSFHYWRQPQEYWEQTFLTMRAAGLNAIQTYLNWALHEPEPGEYRFSGQLDILRFVKLAQKQNLLVILRPGPFIDAEVDMGGFPYWLLRENPGMQLRSSDPTYMKFVQRWYSVVLPMLRSMTYANGGPIISAQIENEYGATGINDAKYKQALKNWTQTFLGPDIVLFTTDNNLDWTVKNGQIDGALATVDFGAGSDVNDAFRIERLYNIDGPLVNSEYYPGWLDHWAEPFAYVDYKKVVKTMEEMLLMNASFNVYMFYGGTNFGFSAGANAQDFNFQPITTSYDYDAPISEAGDAGSEKFMAIRQLLAKYMPDPPGPIPPPREKAAYGKLQMEYKGSLYHNLEYLVPNGPVSAALPLAFEDLRQPYGFVLYRTTITSAFRDPALLLINELHDRAIIFIDKNPVGVMSRSININFLPITLRPGSVLDILVHNEGRVCVGPSMNYERKGIIGNATLDGHILTPWKMFPLQLPSFPVTSPKSLKLKDDSEVRLPRHDGGFTLPSFFSTHFVIDEAKDTFLDMTGWRSGYAFINGRNLGRYWPVQGPQITLYVPGVYLNANAKNTLDIFELDGAPCSEGSGTCAVNFVTAPILNGTVPNFRRRKLVLRRKD
ncbi:beta-galactosidase-like [Paramacrobiotus metropolitanus]|uniref:beta-galactosidase-like n=1 Tax=Paramacrobiotus metropolitanus TaxID=2943436 RepID=UPI00244619B9|nr:beta-galactosidase-like [Paramacrobiotus metropolitanus]